MIRAIVATLILYCLLQAPDAPGDPAAFLLGPPPLELPALILLFTLASGRALTVVRSLVTVLLTFLLLIRLADLGTRIAFARPFNLATDFDLLAAGARLASGTFGPPLALAAAVAVVTLVGLLAALIWWCGGQFRRLRHRRLLALALIPALLLPVFAAMGSFAEARTSRLAYEHVRDAVAARRDLAEFRAEAARDPYAALPASRILPALRGHDIYVVFVESYGRSALDNPLYAPRIRATLAASEAELARSGLSPHSGWLTAPMVGGQSWLAHGSLLSGLRIDTQARYRALMESPRATFPRLAQKAGWQSVAVMPAITLAWPEAGYFGYDRVLAAADLGYRGPPFNWVTMPDQFTLASFERRILSAHPRPPVIAEIALISSHAPWTPVPPILDWDALGDGEVFDAAAVSGKSPEDLWRDPVEVRVQYLEALDYALKVTFAFAARHGAEAPLILVLGDHQPAAFVSGDPESRAVPAHFIGPPDILRHLDGWGWTPGLLPAPGAPVWPMEAFRDRFLDAFGAASGG